MKMQKRTTMRSDTKRAKQKQETRKRILEAAQKLFDEQGFFDTSPTDIAKEAGVAYGSVYSHFETKGDILTVLQMQYLEDKFLRVSKIQRDGRTAFQHFFYLIDFFWDEDTGPALANFNAFLSYIWVHGNKENKLSPKEICAPFLELMTPLLQEAKDTGDIPTDTDIELMNEIGMAVYFECIRQVSYGTDDKDTIKQKLHKYLIHTFRADPKLLD